MKRLGLITLLLCCVTLSVPAQNVRNTQTVRPNNTPSRTSNRTTQTTPKITEIPVIPPGLFSALELETQLKEAIKAIELTTLLLNETGTSAKSSLNRLNLLSQQLLSRKKVIAIIGQELSEIDKKITKMSDDIELLDKDLTKTKDNYAKSMQNQQQEYRSSQYKLLIILSADNLMQSYRRMRYLREYANWQKEEADRIVKKQSEIINQKTELEKTKQEKQELLTQRENENNKLINEEKLQQKEVRDLNNKQKELQRSLEQKRKESDALNKQIERLIAEDTAEKNKRSEVTIKPIETPLPHIIANNSDGILPLITTPTASSATPTASSTTKTATSTTSATPTTASPATSASPSTSTNIALESESILTKTFTDSKGRLPFPLTGPYTVISAFGEHQHQDLSYVRTNNNGIDIQTTEGSEALAIFKGIITRVFVMPGYNNNVIIRHGDYLTVYSNLSAVYVKAGDIVSPRQTIGKIFTDTEKGNETILHFQLWNERTKLNPSAWIK